MVRLLAGAAHFWVSLQGDPALIWRYDAYFISCSSLVDPERGTPGPWPFTDAFLAANKTHDRTTPTRTYVS